MPFMSPKHHKKSSKFRRFPNSPWLGLNNFNTVSWNDHPVQLRGRVRLLQECKFRAQISGYKVSKNSVFAHFSASLSCRARTYYTRVLYYTIFNITSLYFISFKTTSLSNTNQAQRHSCVASAQRRLQSGLLTDHCSPPCLLQSSLSPLYNLRAQWDEILSKIIHLKPSHDSAHSNVATLSWNQRDM